MQAGTYSHLVAEIQVVYKSTIKPSDRPEVKSAESAYEILLSLYDENTMDLQESFKVIFLDRANRVLAFFPASVGGITGTVADPRLILKAALDTGCCGMILSHNHPSGNLKPSKADEELTYKINEAAKLFDIKVLDHIILSSCGYYSFANEGLL